MDRCLLRVGLDAHVLGRRQTGNETYILGLLHGFEQIGFQIHAYGPQPASGSPHIWRGIRPSARLLRLGISIPTAALLDRLDLYHGVWTLPPVMPCPSVVTVHDLSFVLRPEWFPRHTATFLRRAVGHAMRKASRVVTISERTKADILDHYDIDPERIAVTYLAPRPGFDHTLPPPTQPRRPHFVYVGALWPRKNVPILIRALALLRDSGLTPLLVLAGPDGAARRDVDALVEQLDLGDQVCHAGYLSDEGIRRLYAGCTALLHPALYEGFGITPIESMAMGCPALAADSGALPEVVGDGGLLLPPNEPEVWASAMQRVLCDASFRDDLIARGQRRAAAFSWERCARETLQVYEQMVRGD